MLFHLFDIIKVIPVETQPMVSPLELGHKLKWAARKDKELGGMWRQCCHQRDPGSQLSGMITDQPVRARVSRGRWRIDCFNLKQCQALRLFSNSIFCSNSMATKMTVTHTLRSQPSDSQIFLFLRSIPYPGCPSPFRMWTRSPLPQPRSTNEAFFAFSEQFTSWSDVLEQLFSPCFQRIIK